MRRSAAALLLALALAPGAARGEEESYPLPPAPAGPRVDFSAEHFDYLRSSSVVHLKGEVRLQERGDLPQLPPASAPTGSTAAPAGWLMRSEEVWLNLETRRARAAGFVQLEDGESLLSGDSGEYDYAREEGALRSASAGFPPWRIHSRGAAVSRRHDLSFRSAWFTSCNLDVDPHYHFRSSLVRVRPKRWLYALNTVFFVKGIPVFYTPFLWKSLRKKHLLRTRFSPGYDKRNGANLRSQTLYELGSARGKLYLDYYGLRGVGAGSELDLRVPGLAEGGLYGYRIRESSGAERWAVLGDHYQALPSSMAFQMRLQTQSDPTFNNDYARSNRFRVAQELVNGAALVRSSPWGTTRLSYSRLDSKNPGSGNFRKAAESLPRLDAQSAALVLPGSGVINTFSGFADNAFDANRSFLQRSAGAGWRASRAMHLFRGASFAPALSYDEIYESRRDSAVGPSFSASNSALDAFTGRYGAGGTLRLATPAGDWDLGYDYRRRMAPDSFSMDSGALDHGVESNAATFSEVLRPHPRLFLRLGSGYDWRVFRDRTVGFRERVQPMAADLNWALPRGWGLAAREEYQLVGGNGSFLLEAERGDREGSFLALGLQSGRDPGDRYLLSQEFGWAPSSATWKVGAALRSDLRSRGGTDFSTIQLFEKELWARKDLHDFRLYALMRVRPGGVQEGHVRIELRLDRERPIRQSGDAPWRPWKTED